MKRVSGAVVCANQPSNASRHARWRRARGLLGSSRAAEPRADIRTATAVLHTRGFCRQKHMETGSRVSHHSVVVLPAVMQQVRQPSQRQQAMLVNRQLSYYLAGQHSVPYMVTPTHLQQ